MGVSNLVEDQKDCHVKAIAEFAIAMINAASMILIDEDEPNKGYVQIRVGFHSGKLLHAGSVGLHSFLEMLTASLFLTYFRSGCFQRNWIIEPTLRALWRYRKHR